jgi:subtilisin family serine protease
MGRYLTPLAVVLVVAAGIIIVSSAGHAGADGFPLHH